MFIAARGLEGFDKLSLIYTRRRRCQINHDRVYVSHRSAQAGINLFSSQLRAEYITWLG